MKTIVTVMLLIVLSAGVVAAVPISCSINDCRTGVITAGAEVDLTGEIVVTVVRYNGFACTETAAGPYTAIWVYTGGAPTVVAGDVITITGGEYVEYFDLSEIVMATFGGTVTATGTAPVPALAMSLADVLLDSEGWESHVLTITDGFFVAELADFGEWSAVSWPSGTILGHDDYFFDETVLSLGDCYQGVTGMYTYSYGAFKMQPLVDGLTVGDCAVTTQSVSFGGLKGIFR